MRTGATLRRLRFTLRPLALAGALAVAAPVPAQVATDGSLGGQVTTLGSQFVVPSTIGRIAGANVFHSFRTFNVARNQSVSFTQLGGIQHIIARVTGGTRSEIFGHIRVDSASASLFLLNPSGILLGTGASIDVPGAFYASTADAMRFSDGTRFSARIADGVTLSVSAPAAFAFSGPGAPLTVSGASLVSNARATIGLVGGDIRIERGTGSGVLSAPAGSIGLIATRGAGEVALGPQLQPVGFAELGRVEILNGTRITVAEGSGSTGSGRIFIRGGEIVVDHARLDAATRRGPGGAIDLVADAGLALHGAEIISVTTGAGAAGAIRLAARDVAIDGGSLVDTSCDPGCTTGSGGPITIVATERIDVAGEGAAPTYIVSNSLGGGAAGRIELSAPAIDIAGAAFVQSVATASGSSLGIAISGDELHLSGGAQVDASSRGSGAGGAIDVTVKRVLIEGFREDLETGNQTRSGLFSNSEGRGDAGAITVRADSVRVLRLGEISSSARPRSSGNGGTITLEVSGELEVTGGELEIVNGQETRELGGIFTNTRSTGAAGDIVIRARRVVMRESGALQSQSEGAGAGGSITLALEDLTLLSGALISTDAKATGDGGRIEVRATGTIRIEGIVTGFFSQTEAAPQAEPGADPAAVAGRGGSIDVVADTIVLSGGGLLTSSTLGEGNGGNVIARALSRFEIGSQGGILSESEGRGLAGDIVLRSDGNFDLRGRVTTSARSSDGGNIAIAAAKRAFINGGRVTTAVGTGRGDGGNIDLDTPTLVLLDAVVSANAFGGDGGNIHIAAPTFILDPKSSVTASSELGIDGIIQIDSPAIDLSGALTTPLPRYLDADAILSGRCNARLAGKASSLSVVVRDRLPESASSYFLASAASAEQCAPTPPGGILR